MTDDQQETLALAVQIANLIVTGRHSPDPQIMREARASLDLAFGLLVAVELDPEA